MINFSVKPSSYTGASDTNGGGYVDGYDATYANFCTATGGPTTVYQFSEVSETGGVYSFTFTSGTGGSNYIAGQLCYIEHPQYGFWYGRVVATYPADVLRVVYVPVNGGTGYLSEESIAILITNNIDAGGITVGGALADPVFAATLQLAGGVVLIESVSTSPATYPIMASIDGKLDGRYLRGVDENGELITVQNAAKRPTIMPGADITDMVDDRQSVSTALSIESIVFDGNRSGTYKATYGLAGPNIGSYKLTANLYNVDFDNNVQDGIYSDGFLDGDRDFVSLSNNGRYGIYWRSNSRYAGIFNSSSICGNVSNGITGSGTITLNNSIVCDNGGYGSYRYQSDFRIVCSNCTMNNNASGDIYCATDTTAKLKAINSILNSDTSISTSGSGVIVLYNSYCRATISTVPAVDIGRITDEPPFIGDTGDDKYMLDPDHANFASYYNNNTGEIYAGAYGPKVTTGTGDTGVCNLIGNGGMIE